MPELPPLDPLATIESVEEWTQRLDDIIKRSSMRGRTFDELKQLADRVRGECFYWKKSNGYLSIPQDSPEPNTTIREEVGEVST